MIAQRLMPSCQNNTVSPQILNFQARYASILNNRRTKHVRPAQDAGQEKMLNEIWHVGRLGEEARQPGLETMTNGNDHADHSTNTIAGRDWLGWRRLGLIDDIDEGDVDEPAYLLEVDLFRDVGELGLECLVCDPTTGGIMLIPIALVCHARRQLSCGMLCTCRAKQ
jgi:engulfment/cell motility protein 1